LNNYTCSNSLTFAALNNLPCPSIIDGVVYGRATQLINGMNNVLVGVASEFEYQMPQIKLYS
jgi:hypothetical protein